MKYWKYVTETDDEDQFNYKTISEREIIRDFYEDWKFQQQLLGKDETDITEENCIEEWVIYYSAWQ
jgi:hypothetical protein